MRQVIDFIAGLPKVELHVHHVGSASPRIVAELAARHPGTVPSDPEALRDFFVFEDFPHFIRNYLAVVDLIRTAEDVRLLTYEVAAEMAAQQIRYAELTVTPYISVREDYRWRRSSRPSRMPGWPRNATTGWSCAGSSTSRPTSASGRRS
jgi:aminodeoxyfutalosine deaminase